jgi:hypothetical protein
MALDSSRAHLRTLITIGAGAAILAVIGYLLLKSDRKKVKRKQSTSSKHQQQQQQEEQELHDISDMKTVKKTTDNLNLQLMNESINYKMNLNNTDGDLIDEKIKNESLGLSYSNDDHVVPSKNNKSNEFNSEHSLNSENSEAKPNSYDSDNQCSDCSISDDTSKLSCYNSDLDGSSINGKNETILNDNRNVESNIEIQDDSMSSEAALMVKVIANEIRRENDDGSDTMKIVSRLNGNEKAAKSDCNNTSTVLLRKNLDVEDNDKLSASSSDTDSGNGKSVSIEYEKRSDQKKNLLKKQQLPIEDEVVPSPEASQQQKQQLSFKKEQSNCNQSKIENQIVPSNLKVAITATLGQKQSASSMSGKKQSSNSTTNKSNKRSINGSISSSGLSTSSSSSSTFSSSNKNSTQTQKSNDEKPGDIGKSSKENFSKAKSSNNKPTVSSTNAKSEDTSTTCVVSSNGESSASTDQNELYENYAVYEFHFPRKHCGRLIGKNGVHVDYIRSKTHTQIAVRNDPNVDELQIVCVSGRIDDVDKALDILRARFPQKHFPLISFKPISKPILYRRYNPEKNLLFSPNKILVAPNMHVNINDVIVANQEDPSEQWAAMFPINLTSIVNTAHVFIQLPTHSTYENLQKLDECMLTLYGSASESVPNVIEPIENGTICVAPTSYGWHRAMVTSYQTLEEVLQQMPAYNQNCGLATVKFLDYGGYLTIPVNQLRQLR